MFMLAAVKCLLLLGLLIVECQLQKPNTDIRRHDVYIAGFFPFGKSVENSEIGRGVMPSVKLALEHVNEHSLILRNYHLHMFWNDTECNAAVGVKSFFDMMYRAPHKVMLFGAACTHVTDPIAKASKHWHLTQLSYADTHPMFTKKHFPNFFRIVPSENAFNPPRLSLLKEFNWTRVGTIYQNEPRYSLAHNRLVAELDIFHYEVVETQSFTNEVISSLTKLREKDVRVILGNFNERWGRSIFCEAYKLEMYGRRYQWLIMGTYSHDWWKKLDPDGNCTLAQIEVALEQTILTDLLPLSTSGEITISGITADEYQMEYDSRRGLEYSRFHGYTYDGIWAVALAIQNVAHKVRIFKRNETVVDFKYRDPLWERLFLDALHNTSFEGVTGPVRFYDNERKAGILLKQFQDGAEIKVGEYSAATQHLDLTLGSPMKWIGKHPPKDRTLEIIEHTRVNKTVYAILASLAICGIVMATVFLAFNIKYRNQRYIKMSSPQLNNLIIIGCMLTYTSIVFLGLDSGLSSIEAFPYICTARAWTLMAGFSLAFGAMFSKTWRVHSIFTDVKLNKKVIKDYQLFMVVGVLLFIDLVIMTTWQVADPFQRATKRMEPYPHPSSEDIIIVPENEYCTSERMTIFVGSIYAYKGLLMIFGAFLAWETRKVSIPALNDSRHVGLSVYNVAIMCICGAAVALVLVDHQDAMFLIIGVFVLFCSTATLWLVFVPKIVELKRNPGGSIDTRIRATLRPMSKTGRRDSSTSELESKMKEVKAANSRFRKTLLDKESELQMLIKRLGSDAKDLLDFRADSLSGDVNRLSVPLLRKEQPSATETSDITSLCSLSSQDFTSLQPTDSQRRRKTATIQAPGDSSPKHLLYPHHHTPPPSTIDLRPTQQLPPVQLPPGPMLIQQNGNLQTKINTEYNKQQLINNNNQVPSMMDNQQDVVKQPLPKTPPHVVPEGQTHHGQGQRRGTVGSVTSYSEGTAVQRRCSLKSTPPPSYEDQSESEVDLSATTHPVCHQRIPASRTTPPKKRHDAVVAAAPPAAYGGTHIVSKSELWDTGSAGQSVPHRCPAMIAKSKERISRVGVSQADDDDDALMHRSVSERQRHQGKRGSIGAQSGGSPKHYHHHHHRETVSQSVSATSAVSAAGGATVQPSSIVPNNNICHQHHSKMAHHFQSTPNVATATGSRPSHSTSSTSSATGTGTASTTKAAGAKRRDFYAATSESELLDREILPIFQKLLTERNKSQHNIDYATFGRSCPNISIKCDIVEYL